MKASDILVPKGCAPGEGQITAYQGSTAYKPEVRTSPDLKRVLALPRRPHPALEDDEARDYLIQYVTGLLAVPNEHCDCRKIRKEGGCIVEFKFAQAWALLELIQYGGILGGIGVGHGKTLLGIVAPLAVKGCKKALILVPPKLVDQLVTEYRLASQHFRVPSLVVHGRDWSKIVPGMPVLHVMPYSRLSRSTASDFIKKLNPDLILADEVHKLKDIPRGPSTGSATAARVDRHLTENPTTRFAGWTGSITNESLNDYGHLAKWALKQGSPLPLDPNVLDDWARAIDPSDWPAPPGALLKMCNPGEHIHKGYHRRLVETPGVVITKEGAISAPLIVTERKAPPLPEVVKDALASIRAFVRPDGADLVEATEVATCARQAACGFYYRWKFENGETDLEIERWLRARKEWSRELRQKLTPRHEYLDSPLLCEQAATRYYSKLDPTMCPRCEGAGSVPPTREICKRCIGTGKVRAMPLWESEFWRPWEAIRKTVVPITETMRFSPYLAEDAAAWGLANKGVIWSSYNALSEWIAEISGLPLHGGGPDCDKRIAREDGSRSIVASIQAHGTGRDGLQRLFHKQLICTPMSSATAWEQLLGRLHRLGQDAFKVYGEVYLHTEEFRRAMDKAMTRSLYVQDTLGAHQKVQGAME